MNKKQRTFASLTALWAALLLGCSSQTAPGFRGHWTPINRFADSVEAIPIRPSYVFYASPVDATLKTLLDRWAKDAKKTLSYRHPDDFTLYAPVAHIRTNELKEALEALNSAYAGQRVSIALEKETIIVTQSASAPGLADQ